MRPNLGRVLCGGCVATPAMTVLMYTLAPAMGVQMDIAAMLGSMLGGWKMGMLLHIMNGVVVFPLAYALLLHRLFPGSPLVKGLGFGVLLWLLSQLVVMPLMGAGLFSSNIGGTLAVLASLLGHIRLRRSPWLARWASRGIVAGTRAVGLPAADHPSLKAWLQ